MWPRRRVHPWPLFYKFQMRITSIIIALAVAASAQAQGILTELAKDAPGQGKVVITQSPEVAALVGSKTATTSADGKTINTVGFRIQLFAGNNSRAAKDEVYRIAALAKKKFPDYEVYTVFQSPRWLCRFGDFKTIEEADSMMRELEATGEFNEMSIIRSHIILKIGE